MAAAPLCSDITVTAVHGPVFYIDTKHASPILTNQFVGYKITNNGASLSDVYVMLGGWTGGVVTLAADQPAYEPLGDLAGGGAYGTVFFDLYAPQEALNTPQGHTITIISGHPYLPGSTAICQTTWAFAEVAETTQASANKVTSITASTTNPVVGGTVTVTVEGDTGTIGGGTTNDVESFWMSPSALNSWPAGSFRLRSTALTMSLNGTSAPVTTTDVLRLDYLGSKDRHYVIVYTFDIVGTTNGTSVVYPNQEIASGTQIKHTQTSQLPTVPPINPPGGQALLTKSVDIGRLPSSGGTVTYTLAFSTTAAMTMDAIVDHPPAGATFVPGSAHWGGALIANPLSDGAGGLVFDGPFTIPPAGKSLTYQVTIPGTPGTYVNSAYGLVWMSHVDTTYAPGDDFPAKATTIVPALLTVTASSASMTYGGTVPAITPSYSGFINGEGPADLDTQPTCSTTATSSSPAGSYPSSCTGGADPQYDFAYVNGSVTVDRAGLVITASNGSMTYGGTVPTIAPSYSGWVNGDGPSALVTLPSCQTAATSSSAVGSYASTCSGAASPNYTISYVPGTVTVGQAALTITASSGSMTYGGSVPTITPSYSGWVSGDGPSSLATPPTCSTAATSSRGVGTYPSSCSGAVSANYAISYLPGVITVGPAPLTVTASSHSMAYGDPVPTITPSYSGWVNGDGPSALSAPPTCSTAATSSSLPGTYASTCSGAVADNYAISYVPGEVVVGRPTLTITGSDESMTYGGGVPAITPVYSGFVNGDGPSNLDSLPVCSTDATSSSGVGLYTSSCSGASSTFYDIVYEVGTVTIDPASLIITASDGSMVYGGTVPTITPSYSGFVNGDDTGDFITPPMCGTAATSSSPAGSYASSCWGATIPNYEITYEEGLVTVEQATLTITASDGSMTYGGTVPTITPSYSGFISGEGPADLTTLPTCGTTATSSSGVGNYLSSCSGAVDPNYDIQYVDGTVTVEAAALVITASSGSMAYGGTVPAITPSYGGFVNGEGAGDLDVAPACGTTATGSSPVGTYPSSCSSAVDPNYDISYVDGTVTVDPATLTITASGGTMPYGGTVPTITPSYGGWVNGDGPSALTVLPTCSTAATSSSPVGPYASSCSGAAVPNYDIDYVDGTVTVTALVLTITASDGSMTYGGTVPAITPSYSGFLSGEGPSDLTAQPTCGTAATSSSPVGSYASTCSGATSPNYAISYIPGNVTVSPAALTITASSEAMVEGGAVPSITPIYSGLVAGDGPSDLNTQPTCGTTATSSSPAGTYPSTCSGATDPNYTIGYAPGTVTVNPAGTPTLIVTASGGSMTYGGTVPAITPSYSGWVNGDGPGNLTGTPTCSTAATSASPVGPYPSSCTGAAIPGYVIQYVAGSVMVDPAPLVITASSDSMVEGGPVPAITPSYAGFVNGQTAADLTTAPTCSTTATDTSPAGSYPSSCTGAAIANYAISYVPGTVVVGQGETGPTPSPSPATSTDPGNGTPPPTGTAGSGDRDSGPYPMAVLALAALIMACLVAYVRIERQEVRRRYR